MVCILSGDDIMHHALVWAGFNERRQCHLKHKTNESNFKDKYGSAPIVCAQIWEDLQTTAIPEAFVDRKHLDLKYFMAAMNWLYRYPTDKTQAGNFDGDRKIIRKWKWYYVEKIAALKAQKVIFSTVSEL